jgi:hypothetical protein
LLCRRATSCAGSPAHSSSRATCVSHITCVCPPTGAVRSDGWHRAPVLLQLVVILNQLGVLHLALPGANAEACIALPCLEPGTRRDSNRSMQEFDQCLAKFPKGDVTLSKDARATTVHVRLPLCCSHTPPAGATSLGACVGYADCEVYSWADLACGGLRGA